MLCLTPSPADGIFEVINLGCSLAQVHRRNVDTPLLVRGLCQLNIAVGQFDEAGLFAGGNALFGCAVAMPASSANFDKDERIILFHDDV